MKKIVALFSLLLFLSCFAWAWMSFSGSGKIYKTSTFSKKKKIVTSNSMVKERLHTMAAEVKTFTRLNHYNDHICFFIDMSLPSGQSRFFVYDLKKDSVLLQGLVAHGSCDKGFQPEPSFSNAKDCGCSSLGKYKVGSSYTGRFGLAYKLYGLDSSNNNAFPRNIVLHAYDCVPARETDPAPICNSRGCPMISPAFLKELKPIIESSKKPILLWIFTGAQM